MKNSFPVLLALAAMGISSAAKADTFGSGANEFEIEFVSVPSVGEYLTFPKGRLFPPVAVPGNRPDPALRPSRDVGSVSYHYRMGKYEISESMVDAANALGDLGITHDNRGPDKPATSVSWFDAARFVNWLNEDQGFTPAYKFDVTGEFQPWELTDPGFNPDNVLRNRRARYFLPDFDEWHKAAYYDPTGKHYNSYPAGPGLPTAVLSGTDPGTAVFDSPITFPIGPADISVAGGLSPYGTMAQGGNVVEWLETPRSVSDPFDQRYVRGGSWISSDNSLRSRTFGPSNPDTAGGHLGFRIASVPEPASLTLLIVAVSGLAVRHRASRSPN